MSVILKTIGKGQVTIPLKWRKLLNLEIGVKATMKDGKIILESISDEIDWDTEQVELNTLPQDISSVVTEGRKSYQAGRKDKFFSFKEL